MKTALSILGLTIFTAVASAVFLLLPETAAGLPDGAVDAPPHKENPDARGRLESEAAHALERLAEFVTEDGRRLSDGLGRLELDELLEAMREIGAFPQETAQRAHRVHELLAEIARSCGAEFVAYVGKGTAFWAGPDSAPHTLGGAAREIASSRLVAVCGQLLMPGGASVSGSASIAGLPAALLPGASGTDVPQTTAICLLAGRPVKLTVDAEPSLVVAARSAPGILAAFSASVGRESSARVLWHVFSDADRDGPIVIAGERRGSPVRRALAQSLRAGGSSGDPAFTEMGMQIGNWRALTSSAGRMIGGIGATIRPEVVSAEITAAASPVRRSMSGSTPLMIDLGVIAAVVLVGLACLWGFLVLWARWGRIGVEAPVRRRDAQPSLREARSPPPSPPVTSDRRIDENLRAIHARLEFIGQLLQAKSHEETRRQVEERVRGMAAEWQSRLGEFEKEVDVARGRGVALTEELDAVKDESERLREMLATTQGHEARLSAEVQALRAAAMENDEAIGALEALQAALLDWRLPVAVVAVDPELRVFAWSPRAAELLERAAENVLGASLDSLDLEFSALVPVLGKQAKNAMRQRTMPPADVARCVRRDGRACSLRVLAQPICVRRPDGEDNEVLGVLLALEDLTAAEEHELRAERETLFLDSLSSSLPVALVVADAKGRVVSWSSQAEELLGVKAADAVGKDLFGLKSPLDEPGLRAKCREALKSGPCRHVVLTDEGSSRPDYLVTIAPFRSRQGEDLGRLLLVESLVKNPVAV